MKVTGILLSFLMAGSLAAGIMTESAPVEATTEVTAEPAAVVTEFVADAEIPLDCDLQKYIEDMSNLYGISPCLVYGMIRVESNFCADAVSCDGKSVGLMQIQERWHRDCMARLGATDLKNPYDNVTTGIDYISELLKKYNGDAVWALTAYNRGDAGAKKYFAKGNTTSAYAEKVLGYANEYEQRR